MKIATILPTAHIWLEDGADYHLCLAHQARDDLTYFFFFRKQAREGKFVIIDNGAAENGIPMDIEFLSDTADMIGCQEIILPDTIYDSKATLDKSYKALQYVRKRDQGVNLMAVPQGKTQLEWISCVREMLQWDIDVIGISKFVVPSIFYSRVGALEAIPELMYHKIAIHLLGYTGVRGEVIEIERRFPNRVRGTDSSIPTLYAQVGEEMKDERPSVELDLNAKLDEELLKRNIKRWKELCSI